MDGGYPALQERENKVSIYTILGCLFWGMVLFSLYFLRPKSWAHNVSMETSGIRPFVFSMAFILILVCALPMGWCPIWNGEKPEHRNQYEVMAESMLNGHLYMEYEVDPRLLEMENPYDPNQRAELGVDYYWDHAFYDGHYYMYFGVVPVFLLFLPYRVLTGENLTTYHATQIFAAMFIVGVFALFYTLVKKFFGKMPLVTYILLSSAFAGLSVWYSVAAPALYATAITAGLCMEIWSLFFFVKAVWNADTDKKSILYAVLGSLLGALAFGCRPPIALANILVLPLLAQYIQKRKKNPKLVKQLIFIFLPYLIVGVLLMIYNHVRFDSPFEFGQSYQLTNSDQSNYSNIFSQFHVVKALNGILSNFISYSPISEKFPYISLNGALINFPILMFPLIALGQENVKKEMRESGIWTFVKTLLILPLLITIVDVLWVPFLSERYRMDIYWLMGILCFICIGYFELELSDAARRRFNSFITICALATLIICFLLWTVPNDSNLTSYNPAILQNIERVLKLGWI